MWLVDYTTETTSCTRVDRLFVIIRQCVRTRATIQTPAKLVRSDVLSNPRYNLSSACSNVHGDADVRYHGCAFECMLRRGRPLSVLVVRVRTVISPCGCAFELCGDADARYQSLWVCAATRTPIFSHSGCAFECVRWPGHPLPTIAGARSNGVRRPGHRPDILHQPPLGMVK